MKFKQKLNKLKFILPTTLMLTGLSLTSIINEKVEQANAQEEKVEFKQDNKKYVSYNDTTHEITLSSNEAQNFNFYNLGQYLIGVEHDDQSFSLSNYLSFFEYYGDTLDNFDGVSVQSTYFEFYVEGQDLGFYISFNSNFHTNKFLLLDINNDETLNYEHDLIIGCNSTYYNDIKSAIELDIQANLNAVGDSITEAIASGLGLTPNLASEFLGGFTALFWDATANSGNGGLTTFSYVALVFLGIAITMAVIKLVLAIIRGSTGA